MELKQAIMERRSVRKYSQDPIPQEIMTQIMELALYAPTASNMQAWNFVVISDADQVSNMKKFSPGMVFNPTAVVVIGIEQARAEAKGGPIALRELMYFDAGIAADTIALAALEFGVGSCIVASFNKAAIASLVGFPDDVKPLLMVALGYAEKIPKRPKFRLPEEVVFYETYGRQVNSK